MSKALRWKILMILGVIALLAWASFPLTETSVKEYIARTAVNQDEAFRDLLAGMDQEYSVEETRVPVSGIERLKENVTSSGIDLTRYFPQAEDNKEAIARIEKATKGRLNLGLDLRGGMHVILAVDELELLKKGRPRSMKSSTTSSRPPRPGRPPRLSSPWRSCGRRSRRGRSISSSITGITTGISITWKKRRSPTTVRSSNTSRWNSRRPAWERWRFSVTGWTSSASPSRRSSGRGPTSC